MLRFPHYDYKSVANHPGVTRSDLEWLGIVSRRTRADVDLFCLS
jgi:hypothetical protein